jgi:hypothetical protein
MVQTEAMAAINDCVTKLEKVSNILFEAGIDEASQLAQQAADVAYEEWMRMQTPPAP